MVDGSHNLAITRHSWLLVPTCWAYNGRVQLRGAGDLMQQAKQSNFLRIDLRY